MANQYLTSDERRKLLKLKVKVMRRAGLTAEIVERNAEISRRNLMRSESELKHSDYRLNLAKQLEDYERQKKKELKGKSTWLTFLGILSRRVRQI
jgi:hypothetical protein